MIKIGICDDNENDRAALADLLIFHTHMLL